MLSTNRAIEVTDRTKIVGREHLSYLGQWSSIYILGVLGFRFWTDGLSIVEATFCFIGKTRLDKMHDFDQQDGTADHDVLSKLDSLSRHYY